MSDIWFLLGIEPTDDKRKIRKAFAEQSRLHHPEEEPEYFAKLNQAYKAALEHGTGGAGVAGAGLWDDAAGRTKEDLPHGNLAQDGFRGTGGTSDGEGGRKTDEVGGSTGSLDHRMEGGGPDSLLKLLDEAEERAIESSRQKGALRDFTALFENPKQAKQADTWKRFFLSEAFLGEQYSEEFGKGLLAYLSGQTLYPCDNLPMGLLQELAIAYAFIPHFAGEEYFPGLKYPKEWYKVSVENTFPARKYVAEVFNMQGRECDLKSMTGRMLRQPANKVRHNAFSDYLAMKEMSREGRLTEREKETWEHVLGLCQVHYLYERNGKRLASGAYEARSECVVKLYVQWLKDERLPEEVLKFFYKKLAFKELDRSSTRGLYGGLKEQVLLQLPQAEELLFGEEGKEQLITKLYRVCSSIINDNQNNYDKFIYEETPDIQERVRDFFALPEWEKLKQDKELFHRIYKAAKRLVMPRSMAEGLAAHLAEGDFPEPQRTELIESLLRSLATERLCRELDYKCSLSFGDTGTEHLEGNSDFWEYYLMRGFGHRHAMVRGDWERDYIYESDGECYLPAYINYIYAPSRAWQKRFVGFDEEREEIRVPVSVTCSMPEGRKLRVEFRYHYCLYFVDGKQLTGPALGFSELQEYAGQVKKAEEFFFLLAVTAVEDWERKAAKELIGRWLGRTSLHPFLIPRVSEMLAADNDRIPEFLPDGAEGAAYGDGAAQQIRIRAGEAGSGTKETERVEAALYGEQERFCFRILISKSGMSIWRQTDYGWQDIIFRRTELGWQKFALPFEGQQAAEGNFPQGFEKGEHVRTGEEALAEVMARAVNVLDSLRQPKPVCRAACALDGMDAAQKAERILEAMGIPQAMEGYCVLRYGEGREKRHDRVFYGVRLPFGFDLNTHSAEYVRSRNYLMSVSDTKIKERKTLIGRFGWGFKYSPRSDYGPMYVYLGESGTFYAYGFKMHRADSLAGLLADYFCEEWEGVTEVQAYEGCLTVSKLDHRLEYCYTEEDMKRSMHSISGTVADGFTVFGGYEMWEELARWMDGALASELPEWVNAVTVGLDWERGGVLTFEGIHEEDPDNGEDPDYEEDLGYGEDSGHGENSGHEEDSGHDEDSDYEEDSGYGEGPDHKEDPDHEGDSDNDWREQTYLPQVPLLVWAKGMDVRARGELLVNALQWYAECGRFAEAAKGRNIRILV